MRDNLKIRELGHNFIDQVCDLLEKKGADYGDAMFFTPQADMKIAAKLSLKTDRLMALAGKVENELKNPINEPIEDTLKDIVGYVLLKLAKDGGFIREH